MVSLIGLLPIASVFFSRLALACLWNPTDEVGTNFLAEPTLALFLEDIN